MTILFGFLIISFVVWGIGDMFRGAVSNKVAEVGGAVITAQQFQSALQNLMFQYQTRTRNGMTSAQAHALGLDNEVLQRLIAEAALDQRAASLGLAISDDAIAAAVRADPNLQDASGQFSRARFDAALREFRPQRARLLRQAERGLSAPADRTRVGRRPRARRSLSSTLSRGSARRRARSTISSCRRPRRAKSRRPRRPRLTSYFEDRKASYRAPEYRGFTMLLVYAERARQARGGVGRGRQGALRQGPRRPLRRRRKAQTAADRLPQRGGSGRGRSQDQGRRRFRRHRQGARAQGVGRRPRRDDQGRQFRSGDRRSRLRPARGRRQRRRQGSASDRSSCESSRLRRGT